MRTGLLLVSLVAACTGATDMEDGSGTFDGKADGVGAAELAARREVEVILTQPYCDVCTAADKAVLQAQSPITRKVVELINGAETSVDAAQFTFSVRAIEDALLAAHRRGVHVRLAIDAAQAVGDNVATRLKAQGVAVEFVAGSPATATQPAGLLHSKFLLVDGDTLLSGSNNWSSTGTSINEESDILIKSDPTDPLIAGFTCHFEAIYRHDFQGSGRCSTAPKEFAFSPGSATKNLLRDQIRAAKTSIDVLMHHLVFADLVKELAKAQESGVRVRVVVNVADRDETTGRDWDRLRRAGGRVRYKRDNDAEFQLMHHKLAVIDDKVLVNGSGNWSGSAFFNNYESFVRYDDARIVTPFRDLYDRLWTWSLDAASLANGTSAARQHAAATKVFFGSLHAHFRATEGTKVLDDGTARRLAADGTEIPVEIPAATGPAAKHAFEYARDRGTLDFMMLTPHCSDERAGDSKNDPNMSAAGFRAVADAAAQVTKASSGRFLALAGQEWSTNSEGNHVGVFGVGEITKTERGAFAAFYDQWLPARRLAGERPLVSLNHPKTFADAPTQLSGSWDQIFGVSLTQVPNASERKRKFNDFGLDDYAPLASVRQSWIDGASLPDPAVVAATMRNLEAAARPYARVMEVLVGRGTELGGEDHVNPSIVPDRETGLPVRTTRVHDDWDYYLLSGWKLAPAAPHDNHFANWGTGHSSRTAITAERLTEGALLEAVAMRSVYASEDENLALRFYADGRVPMGGELGTRNATIPLELSITDPDHTDATYTVRVFRGTVGGAAVQQVAELAVADGEWRTLDLALPATGDHFAYLEVLAPNANRMAWSAPIWIARR